MLLQREVETIVFEAEEITGVKLTTGEVIRAPNIIYAYGMEFVRQAD